MAPPFFRELESSISYSPDRRQADVYVFGRRQLTLHGEEHIDWRGEKTLSIPGTVVKYHNNTDGTLDDVRVEQKRW